MINNLDNVDCVPSNVNSSHQEALLHVFEINEAVIKMIDTCFQAHRVALVSVLQIVLK